MRQMETNTSNAPNTANDAPIPPTPETDTDRNFRLAFGDMQEDPNLK